MSPICVAEIEIALNLGGINQDEANHLMHTLKRARREATSRYYEQLLQSERESFMC